MSRFAPLPTAKKLDPFSFEIYRNTPETAPKGQLVTELYAPLAA